MGLKSMHAEKQSEQPQQSVQDNSLIEQQSQRIAELMKGQEQDSYLIEQQSQKIAELERHISQITQQSQKKDSQISEAISQAEEWKARADQERKLLEEQLNLKKTLRKKDLQASEAISQAEEWKARADQERKLLEEQLNLKKTLRKKDLQASEAISQAEEWKNQAEKSEIQIQKLLSEKQELVSTVAEQGKRIAEQTEQIEKLNEADNVLKLNAELKKQNEKLKQDKLNAEQEAEATVSSVKEEYAAKGRELDRRIGEAAKQSAELKEERASVNQDVERRATAMYQSRKKELDSKFKAQSLSYDGFVLGLLLYGVLTTVFTAVRSEAFVSDFKAFFIAIWQFLVNAFQLLLKGGQWASQLGDKIPQPVVATIVHYLLLIVFVGGIGIGVGVLIFLGASKVFEFYTDDYADTLSLAVFLISLAVSVYFAEPIRAVIPINLLLLLILVHIVYVLIRWYVKGCMRSRGYY